MSEENKFKIDDMPIIVRLILFLAPVIMWVANLHYQAVANTNEIAEIKQYLSKRRDVGERMLERLGAMEAKLDLIEKRTRGRSQNQD